jgi:hypothetical protein
MATWTCGVPKEASFVKWLGAYTAIASVISIIYAISGYVYATKYPPIYVVITLGSVALWYCLKTDRSGLVQILRKAVGFALFMFLLFWLARDYALGEYYCYPARINQFAFWCLMTMCLIDVLSSTDDKGIYHWALMIALSFLAITTLSRGAMLGVVLYWSSGLVFAQSPRRAAIAGGSIVLLIALFFTVDNLLNDQYYGRTFAERYQDLRMLEVDFFLKDRGYNKVISNPGYLIYGSAEGQPERFGDKVTIHNSLIGPWFNYGLIGLVCLLGFVKSTWRANRAGWRIAITLAPILFFHNVTHMFLPFFLLIAIPQTEDSRVKECA